MDGQQRHRLRALSLLHRLADRQLRIDHLVEVADEVSDPGHGQVAFETAGELEDLAQVEQGARASVALRAQLRPAEVTALLEQPVQDVGDGESVAQPADAVGQLDQAHGLGRDLGVKLRKPFAGRFVEAIAKAHA